MLSNDLLQAYCYFMVEEYQKCESVLLEIISKYLAEKSTHVQCSNLHIMATSYNLLSCCHIKCKRSSQALLILRKAIAKNDSKSLYLSIHNLALTFYISGQCEPALQALDVIINADNVGKMETFPSLLKVESCKDFTSSVLTKALCDTPHLNENLQINSARLAAIIAAKSNKFELAVMYYTNLLKFIRHLKTLTFNPSKRLPTFPQVICENAICLAQVEENGDEINYTSIDTHGLLKRVKNICMDLNGIEDEFSNTNILKKIYFLLSAILSYAKFYFEQRKGNTGLTNIECILQDIIKLIIGININTETKIAVKKNLQKLQAMTMCNLCVVYILQQKEEQCIINVMRNALQVFSHDIDIRWMCVVILFKINKSYEACKLWMKTRNYTTPSDIEETKYKIKDVAIMNEYRKFENPPQ